MDADIAHLMNRKYEYMKLFVPKCRVLKIYIVTFDTTHLVLSWPEGPVKVMFLPLSLHSFVASLLVFFSRGQLITIPTLFCHGMGLCTCYV